MEIGPLGRLLSLNAVIRVQPLSGRTGTLTRKEETPERYFSFPLCVQRKVLEGNNKKVPPTSPDERSH